jgi:Rieske Fe-S protein
VACPVRAFDGCRGCSVATYTRTFSLFSFGVIAAFCAASAAATINPMSTIRIEQVVSFFNVGADRRQILKAGASLTLTQLVHAQDNPAVQRPKAGDILVRASDNAPLKPADIARGAKQLYAWAMDPETHTVRSGTRLNRILVVRLDAAKLAAATAPRAVEGIVAYSAVCPHNGCEVNEWVSEEQALFCGCHASKFQPADAGKVLDGPAPNPLPALPLKLTDGILTVAAPFTARITFEQG